MIHSFDSLIAQWSEYDTVAALTVLDAVLLDATKLGLQEGNEALTQIDLAIAHLLYDVSHRAKMLVLVSSLGKYKFDVANVFPRTMGFVAESEDMFTRLFTEWLLSSGISFTVLRSVLSMCVMGSAPVALDKGQLIAKQGRWATASHRLLSLTHNGPILCAFTAIFAESAELQPAGMSLAAQMFNEIYDEYPSATIEFLLPRTRQEHRPMSWSALYRSVLANALNWRRVISKLPKLKELRATEENIAVLRAQRARTNRLIMREANNRSIFANLVTRIHVAQARRYVARTERGLSEITTMQQMSHSIELPTSELADPVGAMMKRQMRLVMAQ